MSTRERPVDRGRRLASQDRNRLGQEIRRARLALGRSIEVIAYEARLSSSHASRIERGDSEGVPLDSIYRLAAAVGLDVRVRAYPGPDPALDTPQQRLIGRLQARLPGRLTIRMEVPLPNPGDQRAWDAMIDGFDGGRLLPLDADSRLVDVQAQHRRLNLKLRDGGLEAVLWLFSDTHRNRAALDAAAAYLAADFPVSARAALKALSAGRHPGGSAVILL